MIVKQIKRGQQSKRFIVEDAGSEGWEVRQEEDSRVLKRVHYQDWHRVERALAVFSLEMSSLRLEGWTEA